ncbi:MAG: Bug family tripartite tricarboxylate transporter substrate binding protein, partial [Limnohabitans sp.]
MKTTSFSTLRRACLAALVAAAALPSGAQNFPTKPVRFIVPFTAGSGTDIVARSVADVMSKSLGQPIVIENKPGAGGTIAAA